VKSGTDYYEVIRFVAGTSGPHPVKPISGFPGNRWINAQFFSKQRDRRDHHMEVREIGRSFSRLGPPSHLRQGLGSDRWVWTLLAGDRYRTVRGIPVQPPFQIMQPSTVVDTAFSICDGGVTWSDLGTARPPADLARNAWKPKNLQNG